MKMRLALFLSFVLTIASFSGPAIAAEEKGALESFEEALESPKAEQKDKKGTDEKSSFTTESASDLSATGAVTSSFIEILAGLFLAGLVQTGTDNWHDLYFELKASESPALPTFRLEGAYQYLTDKLSGVDGRIEAGYLMLGADAEYLQYFESDPKHDMKILDGHLLLRTYFSEVMGINLAVGVKQFWGQNRHTGLDVGLPIYLFLGKHFIIDAQPFIAIIHGKNVYDMGGGISYKYKWAGVRAGYRAINVESQTLQGPRIGLFVQW